MGSAPELRPPKSVCDPFFFFLRFYCQRAKESTSPGAAGRIRGEAGSPQIREPEVGLDPRTLDHDLSRWQTPVTEPPPSPHVILMWLFLEILGPPWGYRLSRHRAQWPGQHSADGSLISLDEPKAIVPTA